jgi:hypothetical protein
MHTLDSRNRTENADLGTPRRHAEREEGLVPELSMGNSEKGWAGWCWTCHIRYHRASLHMVVK